MIKVFIAPRRYVQGVGVLADIGKYVASLGKRALVAWGPGVSKMFAGPVAKSFEEHGIELISFPWMSGSRSSISWLPSGCRSPWKILAWATSWRRN
jgi:glycerol dehydrogenase-like iron-containing ADH family enzyme